MRLQYRGTNKYKRKGPIPLGHNSSHCQLSVQVPWRLWRSAYSNHIFGYFAMATITRSAKSSSNWTENELIAYNITISSLSPDKFFPTPDPPLNDIDPAILNSSLAADTTTLSIAASTYLAHLRYAAGATQEGFIDIFVIETLKLLGFENSRAIVAMHYTIPFTICGEADRVAHLDECLIHDTTFVFLVLVKDNTFTGSPAEAQVVAGAIATFQFNNMKREEYGLDPLNAMTIPCIIMSGTRPTFYLVPVTAELSEAVTCGWYPKHPTQVLRCETVAADQDAAAGMENIEYRKLALKRLLAFKELAENHLVQILEGI